MPPLIPIVVLAGAALLVRREWRRINRELDQVRERNAVERPVETLRRDEVTGEWRPSR